MSLNENQPTICPVCDATICPVCNGKGWYACGETDKPEQVQCPDCLGTGVASEAGSVSDAPESDSATRASSPDFFLSKTSVPSLTELLNEVSFHVERAPYSSDMLDRVLLHDVPALVKVVNRALDYIRADLPKVRADVIEADLAQLLREPVEQAKDLRTKP